MNVGLMVVDLGRQRVELAVNEPAIPVAAVIGVHQGVLVGMLMIVLRAGILMIVVLAGMPMTVALAVMLIVAVFEQNLVLKLIGVAPRSVLEVGGPLGTMMVGSVNRHRRNAWPNNGLMKAR
jgi:hypothetical protein